MTASDGRTTLTFDLFSALVDSRTGGAYAFEQMAGARGWPVDGGTVFDRWDRHNKAAHAEIARHEESGWLPWRVLAGQALEQTYDGLDLPGDPAADLSELVASMADWPLWPDVPDGLAALSHGYRVGLLSNVDDEAFGRTRAAALVDPGAALTSERLRAYKPGALIYTRAQERLAPMVHVATSARDVRGSLDAGIAMVRLRRPGHELEPDGLRPAYEARGLADVAALVDEVVATLRPS